MTKCLIIPKFNPERGEAEVSRGGLQRAKEFLERKPLQFSAVLRAKPVPFQGKRRAKLILPHEYATSSG
jgi:hypothetical protein